METNNQLIDLSHRESSKKSTQSPTNSKDELRLRAFDDFQASQHNNGTIMWKLTLSTLSTLITHAQSEAARGVQVQQLMCPKQMLYSFRFHEKLHINMVEMLKFDMC